MSIRGSGFIRDTLTMILAGGQGERLSPLTNERTKPSVPFGGKYRIIDFGLSNCLNSGLRKIYVLTQYKSDSLNRHLYAAWSIFNPELGEFIYSIPPQQKISNEWYRGTADAIYQNFNLIEDHHYKWVLLLSGDHIYKMDYMKMLQYHDEIQADLTISSIFVEKSAASRFGVLGADKKYKVISFIEKPKNPPEIPDKPGFSFVNMGIYIFNASTLRNVLEKMHEKNIPRDDFGKHVIPYMVKNKFNVYAYKFEDENKKLEPYWVDVGTIDSYYNASMDLMAVNPEFNLYDAKWPLRTIPIQYPPAKTLSHGGERVGRAFSSLVERSIISPNVRVNSFSYITDSIIFNDCHIGRYSKIRRAIIDKNVMVPEGTEIGFDRETDKKRFTVTDSGVVVIPKNYVFE